MRMSRWVLLAAGSAASLAAFPPPAAAQERPGVKWLSSLEDARKAAAASGKLLLLDFYADW